MFYYVRYSIRPTRAYPELAFLNMFRSFNAHELMSRLNGSNKIFLSEIDIIL
jgi:hypothetical protein